MNKYFNYQIYQLILRLFFIVFIYLLYVVNFSEVTDIISYYLKLWSMESYLSYLPCETVINYFNLTQYPIFKSYFSYCSIYNYINNRRDS